MLAVFSLGSLRQIGFTVYGLELSSGCCGRSPGSCQHLVHGSCTREERHRLLHASLERMEHPFVGFVEKHSTQLDAAVFTAHHLEPKQRNQR